MKAKTRSTHQIIEEQMIRWQIFQPESKKSSDLLSVITISREPGSGGRRIAEHLAKDLQYDLFDQQILHTMAKHAKINARVLETLDEKGLTLLEDWISSLVHEGHLWPDQYLRHLMKAMGAIAKHGRAVILGRGANFILPPDQIFRVRIFAPFRVRTENVSRFYGVSINDAKRHIVKAESDRRAFIRKYFNADPAFPDHYDLLINTEHLGLGAAMEAIRAGFTRYQSGMNKKVFADAISDFSIEI